MIDFIADLDICLSDFAVPVLLWPGTAQERRILAIYDSPYQGVTQGNMGLAVMSFSPTITAKSSDVADLRQGDALRVLPSPSQGVAGGDFKAVTPQPDGTGMTVVEMHKA